MEQLISWLVAGGQVLLAGLILGAGLPALFAVAVRVQSWGTGAYGSESRKRGLWLSGFIFAIVILGVLTGITVVAASGFGYRVGFDGWWPTFRKK